MVDIDLAKYFDTVNHNKLMVLVAREVKDKRVLKLIRLFLQSGVMINGVVIETKEGCPQGGLLSHLPSNIMLTELDKLLEKRGHKFYSGIHSSISQINSSFNLIQGNPLTGVIIPLSLYR